LDFPPVEEPAIEVAQRLHQFVVVVTLGVLDGRPLSIRFSSGFVQAFGPPVP
jgi:hypothetical protein